MNIELPNGTVASLIGGAIFTVVAIVMGKPIGEWRKRRAGEEKAGAVEADAVSAAADLERNEYRRTDNAADRWAARAERAEKALDAALADKRKGAEESANSIEQIRKEARDDVHNHANWSMEQVALVRKQAEADMEQVRHAAEARILEAEARHQSDMGALHDRVLKGEQRIEHLNECNDRCEANSARLRDQIAELKAWKDRSDVMGSGAK